MYHFGVHEGRIPITRLVDLLAERPAKIFGLYPRKGTWQVGADADVVLIDPKGSTAITAGTQHSRAGYTAYEGMQLQGRARNAAGPAGRGPIPAARGPDPYVTTRRETDARRQ
jgi:dihydropyrimidinase